MNVISKAIAISVFLSVPAHAAQDNGAFGALLAGTAGLNAVSEAVPAAAPAAALPAGLERALASDVLDLTPANADFLSAYAQASGYAVFELDGAKMTTKPAVLSYVGKALSLPGIPENWDAMIDYLGDLAAIHRNNRIIVVIRNSSRISRADQTLYADLREVAEFSCKNAREWSRNGITMKFVFVN